MIHRFFIPPDRFNENRVSLPRHIGDQLRKVLRLSTGDKVCLLDGTGWEYQAEIENMSKGGVTALITNKKFREGKEKPAIVIGQGLPKWNKMDLVVQKGTELGVTSFVPIRMKRSMSKGENASPKIERLRKIALEAAEQTGRPKVPSVSEPCSIEEFCLAERGTILKIILWEEEKNISLKGILSSSKETPDRIAIIIGPEGGIAVEEVETARSHGFVTAGLGSNILRTETVPLTVASVIQYHYGNLGK
ncbi:MAG: 16S rRNA (uracil(1498)-N(3))-methyltransferase [Nitrospinae bacterium]|nr:16S rRNA (uracil(1498)-N(3))-methyltransferase [Nitrospinota bacterium]